MTKTMTGMMALVLAAGMTAAVAARFTTFKGTVAAVDKARVDVAVHDDHGKPAGAPVWFAVTDMTKVTRGDATVAWADAKLKVGEPITIVVHPGDEAGVEWACPMHADVVAAKAGACPKCSMALRERKRPARAGEVRVAGPVRVAAKFGVER